MKIVINSYSECGIELDHFSPIVDFLLANGHEPAHEFVWGNNRTGYFCHLKGDIDFSVLMDRFQFPPTIVVNQENQTIDCQNTYALIKGGF